MIFRKKINSKGNKFNIKINLSERSNSEEYNITKSNDKKKNCITRNIFRGNIIKKVGNFTQEEIKKFNEFIVSK